MYKANPPTSSQQRRVLAALRAVLPRQALVEAVSANGPDFVVRIGSDHLTARWVGRAGLRQVREVLETNRRVDLIVGSELSKAARVEAADGSLGWVDETGAAEIVTGNVIVSRSGSAPPGMPRSPRWTNATVGVAEAVLCGIPATVSATAEATGHSTSSVAEALGSLTKMGLLDRRAARGPNSARHVVDFDRLLDEYARAAASRRPKSELRCGALWRDHLSTVRTLGRAWDRARISWAATGPLGAELLAPHLSEVTTGDIYVDAFGEPELRHAARSVGLEPIEGGRVLLRPFPTATSRRLSTVADGLRVAPWPRVFADVRQIGVRGEEAAEHLREVEHERRAASV